MTDLSIYRKYNDDLAHLEEAALQRHYDSFGHNEGRIRTKEDIAVRLANFDVRAYRRHNADLADLDDDALKEHWLKYGFREKRVASDDPDLTLSPSEESYVKQVDFHRVAKDIQEILERLSNYQGKVKVETKETLALFVGQVFAKVDRKLSAATQRYLFPFAWSFLIDLMYTNGDLTTEDHIKWLEIGRRCPKLLEVAQGH